MALFPEATFTVFLPESGVVPGTRLEGTLQIDVPRAIPRAGHVHLYYRTQITTALSEQSLGAIADAFVAPLKLRLNREKPLPAGKHSFPFTIAIPPWLPPSYVGTHCTIRHVIEVRLDVDWAIDPTTAVTPTVHLPPTEAVARGEMMRSPPGFHESLVVDVTLDSDTILEGDAISGHIALRGGHDATFSGLKLDFVSVATVKHGERQKLRGPGMRIHVPAEQLRGGASVPFVIDHLPTTPPSFRSELIDHDFALYIEAEGTPRSERTFGLPVHVLPAGSVIHRGAAPATPLGTERLSALAAGMAAATGLSPGRLPVLVEGRAGSVGIRIWDSPRKGQIGAVMALEVADLGLGLVFRPIGVLDKLRSTTLLPPNMAEHYILTVAPERPVAEEALRAFFAAIFARIDPTTDVRLDDRGLGIHFRLRDDGSEDVIATARWAKERAEILAAAIGRLPFSAPFVDSAPAWAAMAAEQSAHLFPHVPAIHGVKLGTRIASGETRELGVGLRTRADGTVTADLDLRTAPLPKDPKQDGLHAVRAVFPRMTVHAPEHVSLEGAAFPAVPTLLLGTLETFLAWLLEIRGERRSDGPYR